MKLRLLLGLGVLAVILARFDLHVVIASLSRMRLGGFLLIAAIWLGTEIVLASGIFSLLTHTVPLWAIAASRQLRDSAADVLPIIQLVGIAPAARAHRLGGGDRRLHHRSLSPGLICSGRGSRQPVSAAKKACCHLLTSTPCWPVRPSCHWAA